MQLFVHVITRLSDSPHLAKELTGTYWYGLFCFKLSKLLLNSNRKGPFKPTFSVNNSTACQSTDSMECVWVKTVSGVKKNKKVQKLKLKTKQKVAPASQSRLFVNNYRNIKMCNFFKSFKQEPLIFLYQTWSEEQHHNKCKK